MGRLRALAAAHGLGEHCSVPPPRCRCGARGLHRAQVGAQTETELKEKKLRVEDALNATKAAVEEGIVTGGGCTLLRLSNMVDAFKAGLEDDEQKVRAAQLVCPGWLPHDIANCRRPRLAPLQIGADIVKRALPYSLKLIANNAGDNGSVVMQRVLEDANPNFGYNAATGTFEDLMAAGIIDPAKVRLEGGAGTAGYMHVQMGARGLLDGGQAAAAWVFAAGGGTAPVASLDASTALGRWCAARWRMRPRWPRPSLRATWWWWPCLSRRAPRRAAWQRWVATEALGVSTAQPCAADQQFHCSCKRSKAGWASLASGQPAARRPPQRPGSRGCHLATNTASPPPPPRCAPPSHRDPPKPPLAHPAFPPP